MYKYLIIFLLVLFTTCVFAQGDFGIPSVFPKEIVDSRHSACESGVNMYFHFTVIDTKNVSEGHPVLPLTWSRTFYSTNNQTSYGNCTMTLIGPPEYDNTYQGFFAVPAATPSVYYYYQVGTDSTFSSWAPKNISNTFPPGANLYANIHDDPAGDHGYVGVGASNYRWNNTDLRNFKLGYSDSRIYAQLSTNGGFNTVHNVFFRTCPGTWPSPDFDQYVDVYHLYGMPIINPLAPYPDSIFFAMLYGNLDISFLGMGITITPGVYKIMVPGEGAGIGDYLDAYTKISDGSTYAYSISGNDLHMWASLQLLLSDPDFGPLRDDSLLVTGCGIASAYIFKKTCPAYSWLNIPDTFAYAVHDFSKNTSFYMLTGYKATGGNTPPVFTEHHTATVSDNYTFYVTYQDAENNLPTLRRMHLEVDGAPVGGSPLTMYSPDNTYNDGAQFYCSHTIVDPDIIIYTFEFSDGQHVITLTDTILFSVLSFTADADTLFIVDLPFGNTYTMDPRNPGEPFTITNDGTVTMDLGLQIILIDPPWASGYAADSNQFVLRARFNMNATASGEFIPASDFVSSDSTRWSTATIFGPSGFNILPPPDRDNYSYLWLQFIAPTISTVYDPTAVEIVLNLVAREHIP